MFVVCVRVWVKPEHIGDFIAATLANAEGARREPGNLRFDVLQDNQALDEFLLYEVYREEEDLRSHQQTEHYLAWRKTVEPWMAQPRKGTRYAAIFPEDKEQAWRSN